jgi:hypothetical protein
MCWLMQNPNCKCSHAKLVEDTCKALRDDYVDVDVLNAWRDLAKNIPRADLMRILYSWYRMGHGYAHWQDYPGGEFCLFHQGRWIAFLT